MLSIVLYNLFNFLYIVVWLFNYVFLAYIILSFFPINENNIILRLIRGVCEPPYRLIMKVLPPLRFGMIDFSPIYVLILINILMAVFSNLSGHFGKLR